MNKKLDQLVEMFVQTSEVEAMPSGQNRDAQILRLSIIAEFDATNLYEKLATLAESDDVRKVLLDIAREEKVHVGEFETLLELVDSEHEDAEDEGEDEAEELIGEE